MKTFPRGIDITAPGGIERLMDFHRLTFGDAVMEVDPAVDPAPGVDPAAGDPAGGDDDEPLRAEGLKALKAERARAEAEAARASQLQKQLDDIAASKLSDIQRAQKERDDQAAENATLKATNARLAALAEHPVPKDYQDLVTGTDEASYLASAKKISELYARAEGKAPKPDPVPGSGNRSGENKTSGGSVSAGREAFAAKKK